MALGEWVKIDHLGNPDYLINGVGRTNKSGKIVRNVSIFGQNAFPLIIREVDREG